MSPQPKVDAVFCWGHSEIRTWSSKFVATHRQIAVSEWSKSQDSVIRHVSDTQRFWPPAAIGLAGTLLLHGIALQTAILQDRPHRISPPEVRELGFSQSK